MSVLGRLALVRWGIAVGWVGCGPWGLPSAPAETGASAVQFVLVAEGFSSVAPGSGIEAEYRMFTVPDMPGFCAVETPEQLVFRAVASPLAGERMRYSGFEVLALDRTQRVIPRVPLLLSVERVEPAVLDLTTTAAVSEFAGLLALRPGRFLLRVEFACEAPQPVEARAVVNVRGPVPH